MALFGDKNKQTIEELENYYSNKEQKTGMAWVMAFLSLLLTAVVFGGLFFGGRAIYRALSDDGTSKTTVTDNTPSDNNATNSTPGESTQPPADNPSTTPSPAPAPSTSGTGTVTDQAASTNTPSNANTNNQTAQNSSSSSASSSSSRSVAAASTALPNTGSGPVLIVAPFATLIAGFFAARRKFIKG